MFFLLFTALFFFSQAANGYLKGTITDTTGAPLPYVSIYVKNTTYGVTSNLKGEYLIELKPGIHSIIFSFVGYQKQEQTIQIFSGRPTVLNVQLKELNETLPEAVIYSNKRDIGKEIMRKVRDKRKFYLDNIEGYSNHTYQKITVEKELRNPGKKDSLQAEKAELEKPGSLVEYFKNENLNLIESYSQIHFSQPNRYKEIILAYNDYAASKPQGGEGSVSVGFEIGERNIVPTQRENVNPYILISDAAAAEFNFYKNLIDAPAISQKQLLSPIATTAPLSYLFDYDGMFYQQGIKIHRIQVTPIFAHDALFQGVVFVEDSTWALVSVDLSVNPSVLLYCKEFRIIQNYQAIEKEHYLPVRREFTYTIKDGKHNILGKTRVDHSDYKLNPQFPKRFFTNEVKRYEDDSFDKDSSFWIQKRPFALVDSEIAYIIKTDSLKKQYESYEYLSKIDSSFNKINIWSFLINGVGHRNRFKKSEIYFNPLISQIIPFGVGGWRHRFGGYYNKGFKNDYLLETTGEIDYGFNNQDIRGKVGVGLTYVPKKFVRTFIRVGDSYELINDFASLSTLLSRSNYVRSQTFSIAQRMELINGLFGELTFDYSDQKPIDGMNLEGDLTNALFGTFNTPIEFDHYIKSEIRLELKYRIKQPYIIKGNKKILLAPKYPQMHFVYRKGLPGLFGSEVDFDYLEIGSDDQIKLGRMGTSVWSVQAGSFVNRANLRVLEHRYFRGSDPFIFSDPTRSFQLLGPTLSTSSAYFRANYIHHFEGVILNKVPLLNRMKLSLAGGGGTLIIPENNFNHFEIFAGIERITRIKEQLFRISLFAVTADNSFVSPTLQFKIGLNFFNSYTRKWDY
ncbi:MAG: DUF5686 and carboxypeptidase regulatory-like domain-containing protein [Flavobacteriales bacterium]